MSDSVQMYGSVRSAVQGLLASSDLSLPHVTVPPTETVTRANNLVMDRIVRNALDYYRRQAASEAVAAAEASSEDVTGQWLGAVPVSLRSSQEAVIQYLGMVVAIDFRHWTETGAPTPDGRVVENFANFYAAIPTGRYEAMPALEQARLHVEKTLPHCRLLRGSAAMIFLLRDAVERHGIHWYDPAYLSSFGEADTARTALAPLFQGCSEDGLTPLMMPATEERIELLLSLANTFRIQKTNFAQILYACDGRLFSTDGDGDGGGFIERLQQLHPRYRDVATLTVTHNSNGGVEKRVTVPILKLAQLTALALQDALSRPWRFPDACQSQAVADSAPEWLRRRRCSRDTSGEFSLFSDVDELSICCDYQIPKALRAGGFLQYDDHLSRLVDDRVLLVSGGTEECAIRVGTLCATEKLIQYINQTLAGELGEAKLSLSSTPPTRNFVQHVQGLDYALWSVGRFIAHNPHHLCRTIMY